MVVKKMKNKECSLRLKNLYHKMKFQHHTSDWSENTKSTGWECFEKIPNGPEYITKIHSPTCTKQEVLAILVVDRCRRT